MFFDLAGFQFDAEFFYEAAHICLMPWWIPSVYSDVHSSTVSLLPFLNGNTPELDDYLRFHCVTAAGLMEGWQIYYSIDSRASGKFQLLPFSPQKQKANKRQGWTEGQCAPSTVFKPLVNRRYNKICCNWKTPILICQSTFRKQVSEQKHRVRKWQKELGWEEVIQKLRGTKQ